MNDKSEHSGLDLGPTLHKALKLSKYSDELYYSSSKIKTIVFKDGNLQQEKEFTAVFLWSIQTMNRR